MFLEGGAGGTLTCYFCSPPQFPGTQGPRTLAGGMAALGSKPPSQRRWETGWRSVVIFLTGQERSLYSAMAVKNISQMLLKTKGVIGIWRDTVASFGSEQAGLIFVSSIELCLALVMQFEK